MRLIFIGLCLAIVYGSLYPFDFSLSAANGQLSTFLSSWRHIPSRGDVLGNVALFVPFGLVGRWYLGRRAGLWWLWGILALGTQLLQFMLPGRDPSLFDVFMNALGAAVGITLGRYTQGPGVDGLGLAGAGLRGNSGQWFLPGLLGLWLAAQLLPFVPSIDWQAYKSSLKPLLLDPQWSWPECLLLLMCWLVFLHILEAVIARPVPWFQRVVGALGLIVAQVIIADNQITATEACAVLLAAGLASGRGRMAAGPLMVLLLTALTIDALLPLDFGAGKPFLWLPFEGFLRGNMLANSIALCQKLFVYGALAWLLVECRRADALRILLITGVLLAIEVMQASLVHGSAEITDPLLFLGLVWVVLRSGLSSVNRAARARRGSRSRTAPRQEALARRWRARPGAHHEDVPLRAAATLARGETDAQGALIALPTEVTRESIWRAVSADRWRVGLAALGVCLLIAVVLFVLLRIPGIPYNVRELFRFGGAGPDLLLFAAAGLSLGWGACWLGSAIAASTQPVRTAYLGSLKVALMSYLLLWLSVTRESLADITGGTVFLHRVVERKVLGQWASDAVLAIGPDNLHWLTRALEPSVRFAALVGPVLLFFALTCTALAWRTAPERHASNGSRLLRLGLCLLPAFILCKVVAFDWSSTDNLNELIASDTLVGLGGGIWLYMLAALISVLGALSAYTLRFRRAGALSLLFALLVSLPLSWWLLNLGLAGEVNKYSMEYSAVGFLLGPDRATSLEQSTLFLRWAVVLYAAIAVLALGALGYLLWVRRPGEAQTPSSDTMLVRLYEQQVGFLQGLADRNNQSEGQVLAGAIDYFLNDFKQTPSNRALIADYIDRHEPGPDVRMAPQPLLLELTTRQRAVVDSVNEGRFHSESRVVRKLLEIYIEATRE